MSITALGDTPATAPSSRAVVPGRSAHNAVVDVQPGAGAFATCHIADQARPIHDPAAIITHPLAAGRYQTPLRYPGAKTGLAAIIGQLLTTASQHRAVGGIDLLVEPFAGGASTSLRLIGNGTVQRVLLADADPLVAAFWQVAAEQSQALIARMREEHATYVTHGPTKAIARWDYWRFWAPPPGTAATTARFESAVKCLFLNRTTFSGILHGRAGPIGGRAQNSAYGIGCRFNPDALADRISYVGHLYETRRLVDVWCMDWRNTLSQTASVYKTLVPNHVIAYLDPPYMRKSATLYNTSFDQPGRISRSVQAPAGWPTIAAHAHLASYLTRRMRYRWVLSYDYDPELINSCLLYGLDRMTPGKDDRADGVKAWRITKRLVRLTYTAAARAERDGVDELLMTTLPASTVPSNNLIRPIKPL